MADIYFSGQGIVYMADRNTDGTVTANTYRDVGNVPSLKVTLNTEVLEHKESSTGNRLEDLRLVKDRTAKCTLTLEDFNLGNLQLLLYGTSSPITGATNATQVFPAVSVGQVVALTHPILTSATVTATAATSGTPTEGTHFTVDRNAGMITIKSLAGLVGVWTVTYSYKDSSSVPMFKDVQKEKFLKFSGLNTANTNSSVVIELYRVVFDPVSNFDLINNDLAQFELQGSVLYDSTRDTDATLGGFGRILFV